MLIHSPDIISAHGLVTVSAKIEFNTFQSDMPERLWFEFPEAYKDMVSDRADGFLIAMVLLAMQCGEDIHTEGIISPRLLAGIDEYQRVFRMWFPHRFKQVRIHCDSVSPAGKTDNNRAVVSAFSGGVDSFFSLWSHLPANDRNHYTQITHTVFVHGFDIKLEHSSAFSALRDSYATMFRRLGINFITGRTNIQQFGARPNWGVFHGTALIGLAHVIGRRTAKFYVPASHTYRDLVPWGTDPRIDHLLSTESMEVVHDGAGYTRIQKTEVISRWPETYSMLKVCSPGDSPINCCRCEKCLRTMVTLDMLGVLAKYSKFPLPIDNRLVRGRRYFNSSDFAFPKEIIEYATKLKRWDIALNITYAVYMSRIFQLLRLIKKKLTVMKLRLPK